MKQRCSALITSGTSTRGSLDGLISQLEEAAAEEKVLEDIFEEEETTKSKYFNKIVGVLNVMNDNLDWEHSKEFRGMMKTVCTFESKYLSKKRLLNFWINVRKVVKKFFREQTSRDWTNMDTFRISVQELSDLRKSVYDLAERRLLQNTRLDECKFARIDPINYILLLRCVRSISLRRKNFLAVLCAILVIILLAVSLLIAVACSNVKICIEWINDDSGDKETSNYSATSI